MRIVGTVPPLSARAAPAEGDDQPADSFQEAIDGIRTVLLRDSSMQGTRVVMVTSAVQGEGKTTLAGHLATSLAQPLEHDVQWIGTGRARGEDQFGAPMARGTVRACHALHARLCAEHLIER